uniref:Uncharacterized protein n=1 Tax=Solanum lycopersicum TaxID=4081 RepID=A0A3Q7EV96_SOLLC
MTSRYCEIEDILTHISYSIVSIVITIHFITFLVDEIVKLYDSSQKGIIVNFFCLTGLLVTRWVSSGQFLLRNLYESLIFRSRSFSLIHTIPYFQKNVLILSKITGPSAILTQVLLLHAMQPFMWIVIISSTSSDYISKKQKAFF